MVNLQPLYELRGRYLAALAERAALRAAAANSRGEYERLKKLYAESWDQVSILIERNG